MIVELSKQGVVTLTAENADENQRLFEIANEARFKAKATFTQESNKVESKPKATYKKRDYTIQCPVKGCDCKVKRSGMSMHLRNAHGILKDGSVVDTFTYNGGRRMKGQDHPKHPVERPVAMPVTKLSDGTYVLKDHVKPDEGLLGNVEKPTSFKSRILN